MSRKRSIIATCRFGGDNGWGHLVRTSALCEFARSEGWETELFTGSDTSALSHELRRAFTRIKRYDDPDFDDALEGRNELDIVFIDEMHRLDSYYKKVRALVERHPRARLVAMDDLGQRSLEAAHLVVNPELGLRSGSYKSSKSLLGERYAMVRRGFSLANAKAWPSTSHVVPVLVMVGGTDPFGWTEKALVALSEFKRLEFAPWVVSGDGEIGSSIMSILSRFQKFEYNTAFGSEDLGSAMLTCRFGIIGCGGSVFELAALNRRFVGLCVADNQIKTARKIESKWNLPVVHCASNGDFNGDLREALDRVLVQLESGSEFRYSKVDFLGAQRVMGEISKL